MTIDPGVAQRLHPASMLGKSLKSLPSAAIGVVGAFSILMRQSLLLAVLAAIAAVLLTIGSAMLGWWRFRYTLGAGEIVIEQGVLSRQRRVIPFDRVRDVAIERPLLARLLGTARVRIETGGGKAEEGDLDMIALEDAERLRDFIRRANLAGPAPGGPAMPAAHEAEAAQDAQEAIVYEMDGGRLLLAGVLNFSLLFIAVAFGATQYLDDLGLFDVWDWLSDGGYEQAAGQLGVAAVLTLAGLVILLGLVTGIARTVARDFNFRLSASAAGLRRRRGLFTLSEVLIPARRTEAARVGTGWFSGLLGYHSLAFQTLGADAKEGGVQVAAPLARRAEVAAILSQAGFPVPPDSLPQRPPARALLRRCGPWLLLTAVPAALVPIDPRAGWIVMVPLAIAGLQVLAWRNDRHLIGADALFMAQGLLGRTLWIVPFDKLQTATTARGPLQRALGLATVAPDTAGAPAMSPPRVADLSLPQAEALTDRLLERFYAARESLRETGRRDTGQHDTRQHERVGLT